VLEGLRGDQDPRAVPAGSDADQPVLPVQQGIPSACHSLRSRGTNDPEATSLTTKPAKTNAADQLMCGAFSLSG
jgi:hypothetical protein